MALDIDFASMENIRDEFFRHVACDCLIYGNMRQREACSLARDLRTQLLSTSRPISPETFPRARRIDLAAPSNVALLRSVDNINSAMDVTVQLTAISDMRGHALSSLLTSVFSNRFFDQLRTKEQLGYLVSMKMSRTMTTLELKFLVQSSKRPIHLYDRIQSFISDIQVGGQVSIFETRAFLGLPGPADRGRIQTKCPFGVASLFAQAGQHGRGVRQVCGAHRAATL
jgi:secreted Zn-dependent insulinase-like peptidase